VNGSRGKRTRGDRFIVRVLLRDAVSTTILNCHAPSFTNQPSPAHLHTVQTRPVHCNKPCPKSLGKSASPSPLVTTGRPKFTPKTAPSLPRSPPHLIHPSLDRTHSPPQTASGSNQPFCHNTLSGPTDTPTSHMARCVTFAWK